MRPSHLFVVVMTAMVCSPSLRAQSLDERAHTMELLALRGLTGVSVAVNLTRDAPETGLTDAGVRAAVESQLKAAAVAVEAPSPAVLVVAIDAIKIDPAAHGFAFRVELTAIQPATLARPLPEGDHPTLYFRTFFRTGLGVSPNPAQPNIEQYVNAMVDEFVTELKAANDLRR